MATPGNNFDSRHKVLGYPIDVVDEAQALSMIEDTWLHNRSMHIVTLNAEMVIQAQQDNRLDRIVRHAHLIVPDGAGAVWALKLDGHDSAVRVPGVELSYSALSAAARSGAPVALIGSKKEVLEKLVAELPEKHPGLNICAYQDGYFSKDDEEDVIRRIADQNPKLVLVAMGVPRQEYFIDKWMPLFPHSVLMGVGGSFDVFAGTVERAPEIYQRLNLEWFYRLMKEPWRFKRMASTLPNFAIQVVIRRYFDSSGVALLEDSKSSKNGRASGGNHDRDKHVKGRREHERNKNRSKDI